ncbi:MAG: cytochrome b/b6 domain-containing protein [Sedimentisphaerales bacterium]
MFRSLSIIGFVAVLVGIVIHCIIFRPKADELFGADRRRRNMDPLRVLVFLLTLLFIPQKLNLVGVLRKLVYLLALLCFVVLLVTGFCPRLVLQKPIYGYWLILHATFSPVFAACVAILACFWAHNCRLDKNYWPWLQRILQLPTQQQLASAPVAEAAPATGAGAKAPLHGNPAPEKYELARKVAFWIIVFLALPLILSPVLSMFPFFGTHGQELLAQLHRYTALLLALVIIVHTYLMALTEAKK